MIELGLCTTTSAVVTVLTQNSLQRPRSWYRAYLFHTLI